MIFERTETVMVGGSNGISTQFCLSQCEKILPCQLAKINSLCENRGKHSNCWIIQMGWCQWLQLYITLCFLFKHFVWGREWEKLPSDGLLSRYQKAQKTQIQTHSSKWNPVSHAIAVCIQRPLLPESHPEAEHNVLTIWPNPHHESPLKLGGGRILIATEKALQISVPISIIC